MEEEGDVPLTYRNPSLRSECFRKYRSHYRLLNWWDGPGRLLPTPSWTPTRDSVFLGESVHVSLLESTADPDRLRVGRRTRTGSCGDRETGLGGGERDGEVRPRDRGKEERGENTPQIDSETGTLNREPWDPSFGTGK